MALFLGSSLPAMADLEMGPLKIELKVGPDIPLANACKALTPLFVDQGPWQFKIASEVSCNFTDAPMAMSPNKGPSEWELHLTYDSPTLGLKLCRNSKINQETKEQVCEAEVTAKLLSDKQLYAIFENKILIRTMVASIYDQLPFKSLTTSGETQIGSESIKSSPFPKKYGKLFPAKVSLTPDARYFKISPAGDDPKSINWLIFDGNKGVYKERLRKTIDQITKKIPIPAENSKVLVDPPWFKMSGYLSLFPETSNSASERPSTIFEARFRALVERPIFGFKPLFEIGIRETTSYITTEFSENNEGTVQDTYEEAVVEDKDTRIYYLIGTAYKLYFFKIYLEPSIAIGISTSTISSKYPKDTLQNSKQKYVVSSTRFGFNTYFHLLKIDSIGEVGAAGSVYFGGAKSKTYEQTSVTFSAGGTVLLKRSFVPKWSNLTDVSLEAFGELTQQKTKWEFEKDELSFYSSNSLALFTAVFGVSGYWY